MIPLIILSYNQPSYLINLINWWNWYNKGNPVFIIDNLSGYDMRYSEILKMFPNTFIFQGDKNDCRNNLRNFLSSGQMSQFDYYVISDPDIMPCPNTPPDFLEIFKHCIDRLGYHHVGFGLKIDDIPDWYRMKQDVINNETGFKNNPVKIDFNDKSYTGHKAPIDTTFALYKKSNGWTSPMPGDAWDNSLRMFEAYHLPWYLDGNKLNPEMQNYFLTANRHVPGEPSAGANNYRP